MTGPLAREHANAFAQYDNPFENDVVREPREVSFSVSGLNDKALQALVKKFSKLDAEAPPRAKPVKAGKAQLVVSPDRGYGKSHLLGRLFSTLETRATTVYVQPFGDPNKAWQSILYRTVQELTLSVKPGFEQLKSFAIATLAQLGADSLSNIDVEREDSFAVSREIFRQLAANPGFEHPLRGTLLQWLTKREYSGKLIKSLKERLYGCGASLGGRERAWVHVFGVIVSANKSSEAWSAAVRWLRAEPLEPNEAQSLGLDLADNDGQGDASPAEVDSASFIRLQQLAMLCSFYRPLLICFDQTEFFVNDPALIKTFGKIIERLFAEVPNQLTVITANSENWSEHIRPLIHASHLDRISSPIELEGIRKAGARELIVQRLQRSGFSEAATLEFLSGDWLESVYAVIQELSVRSLLSRAAERFSQLAAREPHETPSLETLFEEGLKAIRQKPSLQDYDADALIWFLKDLGSGLPGVSVNRPGDRKYFSLQWNRPHIGVAFAFEGGCHWKRWKSIADEAVRLAEISVQKPLLTYVFRTPDLDKVPKTSWAAAQGSLNKAKSLGFKIRNLAEDQVCEIHAARALYSDALQGNIDHDGPTTLAWLQKRFEPFLSEIASQPATKTTNKDGEGSGTAKDKVETSAGLTKDQQQALVAIVRDKKFVDISVVLSSLGGGVQKQAVLDAAAADKNLKAYPGPHTVTLIWQSHL